MSLFEISQLSHYYSRWVVRITYFYEKFASVANGLAKHFARPVLVCIDADFVRVFWQLFDERIGDWILVDAAFIKLVGSQIIARTAVIDDR